MLNNQMNQHKKKDTKNKRINERTSMQTKIL